MNRKYMHPDQWFRSKVIIYERIFDPDAAYIAHDFGTAREFLPVYRRHKVVEVGPDKFEIEK